MGFQRWLLPLVLLVGLNGIANAECPLIQDVIVSKEDYAALYAALVIQNDDIKSVINTNAGFKAIVDDLPVGGSYSNGSDIRSYISHTTGINYDTRTSKSVLEQKLSDNAVHAYQSCIIAQNPMHLSISAIPDPADKNSTSVSMLWIPTSHQPTDVIVLLEYGDRLHPAVQIQALSSGLSSSSTISRPIGSPVSVRLHVFPVGGQVSYAKALKSDPKSVVELGARDLPIAQTSLILPYSPIIKKGFSRYIVSEKSLYLYNPCSGCTGTNSASFAPAIGEYIDVSSISKHFEPQVGQLCPGPNILTFSPSSGLARQLDVVGSLTPGGDHCGWVGTWKFTYTEVTPRIEVTDQGQKVP